jgi:hypothetical protein
MAQQVVPGCLKLTSLLESSMFRPSISRFTGSGWTAGFDCVSVVQMLSNEDCLNVELVDISI